MNKTIILMCDGLGSRWIDDKHKYKHLIPFDDIHLVFRTVQQLQRYNADIFLIAPEEFRYYDNYPEGITHTSLGYRETESRNLLDGILKTKDFWSNDTSILLGDVVFSNAAIDSLFEINLSSWILGRWGENRITGKKAGELFAFTFNPAREDVFSNIKNNDWASGKLWEYFHKFHTTIVTLDDYTDDFDSPEAYRQFYTRMLVAVRGDK